MRQQSLVLGLVLCLAGLVSQTQASPGTLWDRAARGDFQSVQPARGSAAQVQEFWQLVLGCVDDTSRVNLRPEVLTHRPKRWTMAEESAYLETMVKGWQDQTAITPRRIGLSKHSGGRTILWVSGGQTVADPHQWLALIELDPSHHIVDWLAGEDLFQCLTAEEEGALARRLCTVALDAKPAGYTEAIGGAGTELPLGALGRTDIGPFLNRFLVACQQGRWDLVRGYFSPQLPASQAAAWWAQDKSVFRQASSGEVLATVSVDPAGRLLVRYPRTGRSPRELVFEHPARDQPPVLVQIR